MVISRQYKLLIHNISGPFVVTFFISLFVLVMQFLWKYVDDLAGKGLEAHIILELLFYATAHLVPLALPLAVLLSSIMAFGGMGEFNELMAFKSAGISLVRIQRSLLILVVFVAVVAFLFSNNVLPKANLKFGALLWDIKTKKPAFDLTEGVFYTGIDGYAIRVGKKDPKTGAVSDVMIYDHSQSGENNVVIRAERGEMKLVDDETILDVKLINGSRYEEIRNTKNSYQTYPYTRTRFSEFTIKLDLSNLRFERSDIELFKGNTKMLNVRELSERKDSIMKELNTLRQATIPFMKSYLYIARDTSLNRFKPQKVKFDSADFISNFPESRRNDILIRAVANARSVTALLEGPAAESDYYKRLIAGYQIEWHRKFVLSVIIIILFLIGSATGAIIRKGGIGLPSVLSIGLFLSFHIISITGEKLAQRSILDPLTGMWMPVFILFPVSLFLVYKSNRDSLLVSPEAYLRFIERMNSLLKFIFR